MLYSKKETTGKEHKNLKLRDLPLHKKITLTNFMMIIIPVALVVVIMVGILIGILAGAGSSFTIAAVEKLSGTTTNYQLQLMMDSVSEDIVENSRAFEEGSALLEICGELEQMGISVAIESDGRALYVSPGKTAGQVRSEVRNLAGGDGHLFSRTQDGFAYRELLRTPDGSEYLIEASAPGFLYENGEYYSYEEMKDYLKLILVAVFGAAIVIIVITGIWLSKKLSGSILIPLGRLSAATVQVRNGNLDSPVGYVSNDELGQVCEEFDEMRLRLRESMVMQRKYEQQRKKMVAGISHDLSTPITSIKGYASGLMEGIADTPEKKRHYLQPIYDRAADMEQMVESLFLYSKLDMEKEPFHMEAVELGAYLKEYCAGLRIKLEKDGAEVSFENECNRAVYAGIDRLQFDRVLSNLVDNSVKYRKQGVKLKIKISLTSEDAYAVIRFADNGIGIESTEEEKIFDSFYRTDPARSNTEKGSGLGLSIVRQIVERVGGRVVAKGSPQLGLIVTIVLPETGRS